MNTSIRHFALIVPLGIVCLCTPDVRAQAGADPVHRGLTSLWGLSAATVKASESPTEHQWLDTDVAKPKDKPQDKPADKPKDKPADKPKDKPADKPKDKPADKPQPKHCHETRYQCGSHQESSDGFTISVPDWCTKTVCD